MKSPLVLIIAVVVLVAIVGSSHHTAQAADLSAGYLDKAPSASYVSDSEKASLPHLDIAIGANQVDPLDPNAGRDWALKMLLAFIGLSAGSIVLNYVWMQSTKPQRTR